MAKLSISRAWEESKAILARDGKLFATVALALLVFPGIVSDVVTPRAAEGKLPPAGPWLVATLIAVLIALVAQLALIRLSIGGRMTVGEAITHGAKRAPIYIAASLIWAIPFIVVGGLLLPFARPGTAASAAASLALLLLCGLFIFAAVRLVMSAPVASSESVGPIGILQRSWVLTHGNWGRLFGFLLVYIGGALILLLAASTVAGVIAKLLLGGTEPLSVGALLVSLVSQLVSAGISVVLMVMLARIYVQLAGRAELQPSVPSSGT